MPPKVQRTPAKKQTEEEDELDGLIHLRNQEMDTLEELQTELAGWARADRTASDVRSHLKNLERINNDFGNLHQRIVLLTDSKTRGPHDEKRKQFRKLHDQVSRTLERWADDLAPAVAAGPSTALQPGRPQPVIISQPLPRIIPKFDGKYESWDRFKVMFKDVVDKSNEPARIKLYHLEQALIGEAAGSIDEKTIQDGNYERAWELLEERFEDKRRSPHRRSAGSAEVGRGEPRGLEISAGQLHWTRREPQVPGPGVLRSVRADRRLHLGTRAGRRNLQAVGGDHQAWGTPEVRSGHPVPEGPGLRSGTVGGHEQVGTEAAKTSQALRQQAVSASQRGHNTVAAGIPVRDLRRGTPNVSMLNVPRIHGGPAKGQGEGEEPVLQLPAARTLNEAVLVQVHLR
ncbi:uncharacterized protein LOC128092788 [Culex pipiens pallens]|uniref:uncharacterized protein LOC128092788 n=1 Tax=Culex pipiens pallens TaxID=42434 RepID=UPI0022AA8E56|nr:uncharacterized protein LOC128092788 [Culex pipiens pallens]